MNAVLIAISQSLICLALTLYARQYSDSQQPASPNNVIPILIACIIILLIFIVFSLVIFIRTNKKYLREITCEKENFKLQLSVQIDKLINDKEKIKQEHEKTSSEQLQNQNTIQVLSSRLGQVTDELDNFKKGYNPGKIGELSAEIKELTARNKALENLLNTVYKKVREKNKLFHNLSGEIKAIRYPEIYIDFQNKIIRKKDGTEFILSSTAKQYKNDAFRYMEYVIRQKRKRIHLLEFGLNDPRFFANAVQQGKVREFNYEGKFAKVKSGINKTFMENINKEMIIQDDEKIFAYCTLPDTLLRITSKERDVDIDLSPINRNKMPEILTFFGYKTFDYYRLNHEIIFRSNVQESKDCLESALQLNDSEEKLTKLEEALYLDNKNYQALVKLLECLPHKSLDLIQSIQNNLDNDIAILKNFLDQQIIYQKKITNTARIKQEYREIYSWRYVNAAKSKKFKQLGEKAFQQVITFEVKRLQDQLNDLLTVREKITVYFSCLSELRNLTQWFGVLFKKSVLTNAALEFAGQNGNLQYFHSANNGLMEKAKQNFLTCIISKYFANTDQHNHLVPPLLNFIEWLHQQAPSAAKNHLDYLHDYLNTNSNAQKSEVEKLCSVLSSHAAFNESK
jgi:hypothetical protein